MHLKRAPRLYRFDNFPAKECMFLPSQLLSFTHYPPDTSFVKLKALRESAPLSKPLLMCVKGNYDSSMWKILIGILCLQLDLYALPGLPEKPRNGECPAHMGLHTCTGLCMGVSTLWSRVHAQHCQSPFLRDFFLSFALVALCYLTSE